MKNYSVPQKPSQKLSRSHQSGQALTEYALILTLVVLAVVAIINLMGPTIGNVFSNTYKALLNQTLTPYEPLTRDEFFDLVEAVASYTPADFRAVTNTPVDEGTPGGPPPPPNEDTDLDGIINQDDDCPFTPGIAQPDPLNGCPPDTDGDGLHDGIDRCDDIGPLTGHPIVGPDGCLPPTEGPTPTPTDTDFTYPFVDPANVTERWQTLYEGLLGNPINVEYWDYSGSGAGDCNNAAIFDASGNYTNPPKVSSLTGDIDPINVDPYAAGIQFDWGNTSSPGPDSNGGNGRPHPNVEENFCARYTKTIDMAAGDYVFRFRKNDGIRIFVDGTQVVADNAWNPNQFNWQEVPYTKATGGASQVTVIYFDASNSAAVNVELHRKGLIDVRPNDNACQWVLATQRYRSATTAWDDSFNVDYQNSSRCILRLRGTVDLTASTSPILEFFNAYDLNIYDRAMVSVSEAYTNRWNDVVLHESETNFAMQLERFDLTSFTGTLGTVDYTTTPSKKIEVRFVLETDSSNTRQGWWIDDIQVKENTERVFTIPFFDDTEGTDNWIANGRWAKSSEKVYEGSLAWSDSPGERYEHSTNSSLVLDGRLDLTQGTVFQPQVAFWHSYELGRDDAIYVELSLDRQTWYALPSGSQSEPPLGGPPLYLDMNRDRGSWEFAALAIPNMFWNQTNVYVRFRLDARLNSETDWGWWIDNIEFRNKPTVGIRPNWCDDMEAGSANWIAGGDWAITNEAAYDGVMAWSDSPSANYTNGSNSTLELRPNLILISGTPTPENPLLERPVLEFWHRHNLAWNDHLYAEILRDGQTTWETIWTYQYNSARPSGYGSTIPSSNFNKNLAWQREVVELSSYLGLSDMRFRFRLDAQLGNEVSDGWYIDQVCFREAGSDAVVGVPFADDMEGDASNWIVGGDWKLSGEKVHSGGLAFSDSEGRSYRNETNNVLELSPAVFIASSNVKPTLYFWHQFEIDRWDRASVEIRRVDENGAPVGSWERLKRWAGCSDPVNDACAVYFAGQSYNMGWTRVQADLSPYIGQYIRLRWRLESLSDSAVDDGWWIDDVSIVDRNGIETVYDVEGVFFEDIESINPGEWVFEHNWQRVATFREESQSTAIGPGRWDIEWFDGVNRRCNSDATLTNKVGAGATYEIDYNWGNGRPVGVGITADDTYGAVFTRTVFFERDTSFTFTGRVDDGVRIFDGGALAYSNWKCQDTSFTSNVYTFTAGTHVIRIEYYESTGGARFTLNFQQVGNIGAGNWTARWFDSVSSSCTNNATLTNQRLTTQVNKIDFNWGGGYPSGTGITAGDSFGAIFTQTFFFTEPISLSFSGFYDDMVQVYHNGNMLWNSFSVYGCGDRSSFATPAFDFPIGNNTIEIRYFENTGNARVRIGIGAESYVFHDSPSGNYTDRSNTSVMLEGILDMTGFLPGSFPALLWEDRFTLGRYDSAIIEISTNDGATWTSEVYRRGNETETLWKERYADLSAFVGQRITIRFRLDALSDSNITDGWYIDDIRILE